MTTWGDGSVLVDLVERQFAHLFALTGPGRLLFLSRMLQFIDAEPRLSGILEDLRHEGDTALASFRDAEEAIRNELASLWRAHKTEVLSRLEPARAEDRAERLLDMYCPIDAYEKRLTAAPVAAFPPVGNAAEELETDTENLIMAMKYWRSLAESEAEKAKEALSDSLAKVDGVLSELERESIGTPRARSASHPEPLVGPRWSAYARCARSFTPLRPSAEPRSPPTR